MPICEIKTRAEHALALARLDEIWGAKPGDADWEEKSALIELVAAYEEATVVVPPPDPVDAILFRMDQAGLAQKDLIPYIGSASKVSEVLSRKRGLSKEMICRLHTGLGIPLASLMGVEQDVPEGFEVVECVLPSGVVANVTAAALVAGVSVSEAVSRWMAAASWAFGSPVVTTSSADLTRSTSEPFTPEATEHEYAKAG